MAEKELNIYQKLAKIRKQVEVMRKDTKAYGYNYVKEEDILAKITAFMERYDLSLVPTIVPGSTEVNPYSYKKTKTTQKGDIYEENVNEVLVSADMVWTWVNNNNPEERITIPWTMVGQQSDASQSFGSGLTYSSRYFLLKYFNISTSNDDPDKWRSKQREAEAAEDKMIAAQIIEQIDKTIKAFLAGNADKREEVKALVQRYVKNGDYFAITESTLAARLLADIKDSFKLNDEEKED